MIKIYLLMSGGKWFIVLKNHFDKNKNGKQHIIDQSKVEEDVKNYLEFIILAIVQMGDVSGLEIIHTIKRKYNVDINHGAIYTILKELRKDGIVDIRFFDDGISKVYTLTEEGKDIVSKRLADFTKSNGGILNILFDSTQT